MDDGKEFGDNFQFSATPIIYSPPPVASVARIVRAIGRKSQLRRSKSSIVRKS